MTSYSAFQGSGSLVVLVIVALAVPAALTGLRHLLRYRSELVNLATVEGKLARWRSEEEPGALDGVSDDEEGEASSREDVRTADLEDLRRGLPTKSLVTARLDAIRTLLAQRVRINVDTLQHLTWARDAAQPGMGLPAFAGSTALLLGILGTFIGLAAMVQQIDLGLPGEGEETMAALSNSISHLREVLGGMRTAFTTSLYGMTAAVVCFALDFGIGRLRSRFYERLEHFTVQDLLPATVPVLADESLLERVSLQLETSFARLEDVFESNRDALRNLTGAETAFATVLEELRKLANSDARQDLRGVVAGLEATGRSFLDLSSQLPSLVEAVERGHRRVFVRMDGFLRRWFPAAVGVIVLCVWLALWLVG